MTASAAANIFHLRNEIIPVSGYGQYRKTCSQKILHARRKLKIATPKGRKYEAKNIQEISGHDYSHNLEWQVYLVSLAERAWADAMEVKTLHSTDAGGHSLTGNVRSHVLSRLARACKIAAHLAHLASEAESTSGEKSAFLDYGAYWRLLEGSIAFESQKWEQCLQSYADAHVVYSAMSLRDPNGIYQELISENVEEYIRYAAYQSRIPRTVTVQKIVARYARRNSKLVQEALEISPQAIDDEAPATEKVSSTTTTQDLPNSISWRGRTVKLEDARIAQALGAVKKARNELLTTYTSPRGASVEEQAAAYENILSPSQDAVDATKLALDELANEGVAPSDSRMQSLQITRTAVNYDLIGWRIGRNRILCGKDDGAAIEEEEEILKASNPRNSKAKTPRFAPETGAGRNGRKMARLRQRVVLYETTLDSLDSIRELPGVAADLDLTTKITNRKAYFSTLRAIAVARSHALSGNSRNALALFTKALQHASSINMTDDEESELEPDLPRQFVTSTQAQHIQRIAQILTTRFHALVELEDLEKEAIKAENAKSAWSAPLIERLIEYPPGGANLTNLVSYPPVLRPVPVNPIFLDVAWNYIKYPGQTLQEGEFAPDAVAIEEPKSKRGWFSFGSRS